MTITGAQTACVVASETSRRGQRGLRALYADVRPPDTAAGFTHRPNLRQRGFDFKRRVSGGPECHQPWT